MKVAFVDSGAIRRRLWVVNSGSFWRRSGVVPGSIRGRSWADSGWVRGRFSQWGGGGPQTADARRYACELVEEWSSRTTAGPNAVMTVAANHRWAHVYILHNILLEVLTRPKGCMTKLRIVQALWPYRHFGTCVVVVVYDHAMTLGQIGWVPGCAVRPGQGGGNHGAWAITLGGSAELASQRGGGRACRCTSRRSGITRAVLAQKSNRTEGFPTIPAALGGDQCLRPCAKRAWIARGPVHEGPARRGPRRRPWERSARPCCRCQACACASSRWSIFLKRPSVVSLTHSGCAAAMNYAKACTLLRSSSANSDAAFNAKIDGARTATICSK